MSKATLGASLVYMLLQCSHKYSVYLLWVEGCRCIRFGTPAMFTGRSEAALVVRVFI